MIGNRVWADDFNRASLGVGTIYSDDSGTYSISSNTLACSTSNQRALNTTPAAHPPIANVRIRFRRASATFDGGVLARSNVSGLTSSVGNAYIINPFGTQVDVIRRNAGVNNAVGSIAGITYANGDLIDVDVIGTGTVVHFAVWKNIYQLLGTLQDISGARILVPGQTGFLGFNLNSRYDDFEVFDLLDKTPHGLRAPRPGRGPYSIGRYYRERLIPLTTAVDNTIEGTLAATDAADTAALAGEVEVQGDLNPTEAADTFAAEGEVEEFTEIQGDLDATDAPDVAAIAGEVDVTGDLNVTENEAPDVASIAGEVEVQGDANLTEVADTAAIAGEVDVQGDMTPTDAPDVAAISGEVDVTGDLSASDAPDVAAIDGSVLVQGDLAGVEVGLDQAAIAGEVEVQGDMNVTENEAPDIAAINGTNDVIGSMGATDAPDTASIEGSVPVQGDALLIETGQDAAAIAGEVDVTGDLSANDASDTAAITGEVEQPPAPIVGSMAATDSRDTASIIALLERLGILSATDSSDSASITGEVPQALGDPLPYANLPYATSEAIRFGIPTGPFSNIERRTTGTKNGTAQVSFVENVETSEPKSVVPGDEP